MGLAKKRSLIVAVVIALGALLYWQVGAVRTVVDVVWRLPEMFGFLDSARVAREVDRDIQAKGGVVVSLPALPYREITEKEKLDREECIENVKKFGAGVGITPQSDVVGYCTCVHVAFDSLRGKVANDKADEIIQIRRVQALDDACKVRHLVKLTSG